MVRSVALALLVACGSAPPRDVAHPAAADDPSNPFRDYPKTGVCANRPDDFGPFVLDARQAAMRYGLTAVKYTDAPSTQAKPVEVCGVRGEEDWLHSRQCAHGHPGQESDIRGDTGPGGQCGAIIDLFTIQCPEGKVEILMDMYQCGPNERFM